MRNIRMCRLASLKNPFTHPHPVVYWLSAFPAGSFTGARSPREATWPTSASSPQYCRMAPALNGTNFTWMELVAPAVSLTPYSRDFRPKPSFLISTP